MELKATEKLRNYKLGEVEDWAALILARVVRKIPRTSSSGEEVADDKLLGYIFVIDRLKFGSRAKWKLSGGHRKKREACKTGEKPDETPLDTAIREFAGETGIRLLPQAFLYRGKRLHWREDHWKCFFTAELSEADLSWVNNHHKENEGEEPKFFTPEEFYALVREGKFMPEHYDQLVEFALILPVGQDQRAASA